MRTELRTQPYFPFSTYILFFRGTLASHQHRRYIYTFSNKISLFFLFLRLVLGMCAHRVDNTAFDSLAEAKPSRSMFSSVEAYFRQIFLLFHSSVSCSPLLFVRYMFGFGLVSNGIEVATVCVCSACVCVCINHIGRTADRRNNLLDASPLSAYGRRTRTHTHIYNTLQSAHVWRRRALGARWQSMASGEQNRKREMKMKTCGGGAYRS